MSRFLLHSSSIADYRGVLASPAAILVNHTSIEAVGTPQEVGQPADVQITQFNGIVTPSFVNVHAHLDLSGVGPKPARTSFVDWVAEVVAPIRQDASGVAAAVTRGLELTRLGGSAIVGDIAGSIASSACTQDIELVTTFLECIESYKTKEEMKLVFDALPTNCAISPHAPYTCSIETYKAAFESGRCIATHLCETLEELAYAETRTGEIAALEKRFGVWNEGKKPWGGHPLEIVLQLADGAPCIGAHLNYIEDHHIPLLGQANMTVAFCPRASAYFGHRNHRWQEMIEAGVRVALGTDSLLCLDTPNRISVLDEMRLLFERDTADPVTLMKMATVHGANALGISPSLVTLDCGKTAGLLGFSGCDTLESMLASSTLPEWVYA
ncbi:MAG: amidohydrolase family protein [Phycisphaerales bacterium]|jgi:cytosine/adenosine deaminase-related metal-dependent hydrolase